MNKSGQIFRWVVSEIQDLKPGKSITVSRGLLWDIGCFPVERIMENVVGSAYSIEVFEDSDVVVFRRLLEPLYDPCRMLRRWDSLVLY